MDWPSAVIAAIVALVAVAAFFGYQRSMKAKLKVPGASLEIDASNSPPATTPGVQMEGVKSRAGKIDVADETGRGVKIKDADAKKDVVVRAGAKGTDGPKA